LLVNYRRYVEDLGTLVGLLWGLVVAVTLATCVIDVVRSRREGGRVQLLGDRTARTWWLAVSGVVVALMVFWLSRPAWFIYHSTTDAVYLNHVADLQSAAGVAIDPTRSYDEYSLWWFVWYFGWPLVVLATV